jgi:hypothetical protein
VAKPKWRLLEKSIAQERSAVGGKSSHHASQGLKLGTVNGSAGRSSPLLRGAQIKGAMMSTRDIHDSGIDSRHRVIHPEAHTLLAGTPGVIAGVSGSGW